MPFRPGANFDLAFATTCGISDRFILVRSKACIDSFGCSFRGMCLSGSSRFWSLCTSWKFFSISFFVAAAFHYDFRQVDLRCTGRDLL